MRESAVIKICNSVFSDFRVIALYFFFFDNVCPEHISETIGTRVMKFHKLTELNERKCIDQDL